MPNKKSTRNNKKKTMPKAKIPVKVSEPQTTLYYFNGTTFPAVIKTNTEEYTFKMAKEMIKAALKDRLSKEEQIQAYMNQLIMLEKLLYQHCNPYTKNGMDVICRTLDMNEKKVMCWWNVDVCALLLLGAIKNDNNNGILNISGNGVNDMF